MASSNILAPGLQGFVLKLCMSCVPHIPATFGALLIEVFVVADINGEWFREILAIQCEKLEQMTLTGYLGCVSSK